MSTTSSYRTLLTYAISFLLFGGVIWALAVFVQSSFPGNHAFPILMRFLLLAGILALTYFLNSRLLKKTGLNEDILKFRWRQIHRYLFGALLGVFAIAAIWAIIYLVYPFEITRNAGSKGNLLTAIVSFSFSNTLEEFLFRGFFLLAAVRILGKTNGILLVSLLFGLFHLQGTGLTREGLSMAITTFTMSLLLIAAIYYSRSIWTAITLHVTGNLLLHTIGLDGANEGMFQIRFVRDSNALVLTLIYEVIVCTFALFLFYRADNRL